MFASQHESKNVSYAHEFSHDNTDDLFGYYIPKQVIKVGKFRLHNLSLGDLNEFKNWESGKERSNTYAPVMFTFEDLSSKRIQTELGEAFSNQPRVLPCTYLIKGNKIFFSGANKQVGQVIFAGTLEIKKRDTKPIILKGNLTIAAKTYKNVTFTWMPGD